MIIDLRDTNRETARRGGEEKACTHFESVMHNPTSEPSLRVELYIHEHGGSFISSLPSLSAYRYAVHCYLEIHHLVSVSIHTINYR